MNIFHLYPPPLPTPIIRYAAALFNIDCYVLWPCECTTKRDLLAMPIYVIILVPLIRQLSSLAHQVWYADDAAAGGSILQLQEWWSCLSTVVHHLGYFKNARKTWLISSNT